MNKQWPHNHEQHHTDTKQQSYYNHPDDFNWANAGEERFVQEETGH